MFVHEAIAATFLGQPVPHRSDKENARVAAGTQYRLLATLWLSAEKYAFYFDTLPSARSHMAGLVALQLAGCARSFGML